MWRTEAGTLMSLVVPIVVQMGSQQVMTMTDLIFLGHLGRFELAVGTLGSTLFNLLWFGIAGFGTGFDTLGSQSHGARDHVATRNWAMLAAASLSLCCVPASAILLCGRFLASRVLSQDPETSAAVGRFCAVLILGLWPVTLTLAVQKWLQVRNIVTPVALTSLAVAVVNAALNAILIRVARLGLVGSALATSLSRAVNLVLLVEYVRRTPTEWDAVVDPEGDGRARGVSKPRAFLAAVAAAAADARARPDAVARMTRLGARGAVMVAAEASSFDVTVVFASQLGQVALDAHGVAQHLQLDVHDGADGVWHRRQRSRGESSRRGRPRSRARRRGRRHRVRRRVDGGVRAAHRRVSPPRRRDFRRLGRFRRDATRRRHRPRRRRVPNFRRRARRV